MSLIDELKHEHQKLIQLFNDIEESNFTNDGLIRELKEVAIDHLKKEDNLLYPILLKSEKEEISHTAKIFSDIMKKYSVDLLSVIEKLLNLKGKVSQDVKSDFDRVSKQIKDRVTIEETMLFASYDEW